MSKIQLNVFLLWEQFYLMVEFLILKQQINDAVNNHHHLDP